MSIIKRNDENITMKKIFFKYWIFTFVSFLLLVVLSLYIGLVGMAVSSGDNFIATDMSGILLILFNMTFLTLFIMVLPQIFLLPVYIITYFKYGKFTMFNFIKFINKLYGIIGLITAFLLYMQPIKNTIEVIF